MTPAARGIAAAAAIAAAAIAAAALAACAPAPAPLASCSDDLRGAYVADGGQRWMLLDRRETLEAYPLFDDVGPARAAGGAALAGLELAPRFLELARSPGAPGGAAAVAGHVRRRYMRGSAVCVAKLPARITACAGDRLDVVLADPEPPLAWEPCAWPRPGPSRRERWIRE